MHLVSDEHAFLQPCVVLGPGGAQSCSFVMKTNIARVGSKELEPHVQVVLGFGRTSEVEMNYFYCAPM